MLQKTLWTLILDWGAILPPKTDDDVNDVRDNDDYVIIIIIISNISRQYAVIDPF